MVPTYLSFSNHLIMCCIQKVHRMPHQGWKQTQVNKHKRTLTLLGTPLSNNVCTHRYFQRQSVTLNTHLDPFIIFYGNVLYSIKKIKTKNQKKGNNLKSVKTSTSKNYDLLALNFDGMVSKDDVGWPKNINKQTTNKSISLTLPNFFTFC